MALQDYAGMIRGGMSLVPDLVQEQINKRLVSVQEQEAATRKQAQQTAAAKAVMEMEEARRGQEREDLYVQEATAVFANPTAENIASLQARFPQYATAIKSGWEARDQGATKADVGQLTGIYNLIRLGEIERAASMARERYEAEKAAGRADDDDLAIVEALESGDPRQAVEIGSVVLMNIAGAVGPEKMGSTFENLSEEERQRDLHWLRVDKAESDATKAAAEAEAAPGYYAARNRRVAAQAGSAEIDRRYRGERNQAYINRQNRPPASRGGGSKPAPRPKYLQYGRGEDGTRWGFNPKTRKWEKLN